jgi:hypothetical protein
MAERTFLQGDADLWRRTGQAVPACTANACDQGRKQCPCPQDCRLPERDESVSPVFEGLLSRWSLLSAVVMVGSIAAFVLWLLPHIKT